MMMEMDTGSVRRLARIVFLVGGSLSALIAIALIVFATRELRRVHGFLSTALPADGVIEGTEAAPGHETEDTDVIPLISYTDQRGIKHSKIHAQSSMNHARIGEQIHLLYDPDHPDKIWIPVQGSPYMVSLVIGGIGLTALVAAGASFLFVRLLR